MSLSLFAVANLNDESITQVGNMKEKTFEQSVEDPECHWGIETKINM